MRKIGSSLLVCLALAGQVPVLRAAMVLNEIAYNSPGATDVEFVELVNTGPEAQDLAGWYLLDDDDAHVPCLLEGTLDPGEFLVVAGRSDLFTAAYPGVAGLNPDDFDSLTPGAGFALGNTSDTVRLFDAGGILVDAVSYTDSAPWPTAADGSGPTLELANPALDNALATSWSASADPNGTPGEPNSVLIDDPPPVISGVTRTPALPRSSDVVAIAATVSDETPAPAVELFVDTGDGYTAEPMFDDGAHGDGAVGDGVFGALIGGQDPGALVRYYVAATDALPQTTLVPPAAPAAYLAYTVDHVPPVVEIHEFLASNQNGLSDPAGDNDDWLELYNPGPAPVELGGLFLTDDLAASQRWQLPSGLLEAGQFLVIWCDEEPAEGPHHANFRLPKEGGVVALHDSIDHGNGLLQLVTFGPQNGDVSFGFAPDDADLPQYLATPTPGASNDGATLFSPICINEIFTASQFGVPDWIELYNRSAAARSVGGWHVSDDPAVPEKFALPAGTLIAAGGRLVLDADTLGFSLASDGSEVVMLTGIDPSIGEDWVDYGQQGEDVTYGRFPDGTANWQFMGSWTLGGSNTCAGGPALGPVSGLRFDDTLAALSWEPVAGATGYDVVGGDLHLLRQRSGDFAEAAVECIENGSPDTRAWDAHGPGSGSGRFYLVRAVTNTCGFGTYDSDSPGLVESRDATLADAAAVCP